MGNDLGRTRTGDIAVHGQRLQALGRWDTPEYSIQTSSLQHTLNFDLMMVLDKTLSAHQSCYNRSSLYHLFPLCICMCMFVFWRVFVCKKLISPLGD